VPYEWVTMNFGKYGGRPVSAVPISYIRWALRTIPDLDWRVKVAMQSVLASRGVDDQDDDDRPHRPEPRPPALP
jgi:uncharacterized protein (DUF3820 family)